MPLRHEDRDGLRVHEAGHHGLRDIAYYKAEPGQTHADVPQARKQRGGQQGLQPVILDRAYRPHGGGGGSGRDHAGVSARDGGDDGDGAGGVEADLWIDACDDGIDDCFGDQGKGHGQAREQAARMLPSHCWR